MVSLKDQLWIHDYDWESCNDRKCDKDDRMITDDRKCDNDDWKIANEQGKNSIFGHKKGCFGQSVLENSLPNGHLLEN